MTRAKILLVGCGPGSPDTVTPEARRAALEAEVLAGADRLLRLFPESRAERIRVGVDVEKTLEELAARAGRQRVAVLVTGDPGLCSLAQPVIRRFGREACEVIPGVSSVQVAFARLGLEWLDARILSAHARLPDVDAGALADAEKMAILAGGKDSLLWIAKLAGNLGGDRLWFACENLTLEDERVRQVTPPELGALDARSRTIVLMVKRSVWS